MDLLPWLEWSVCSQGVPAGVWGRGGEAVSWGREFGGGRLLQGSAPELGDWTGGMEGEVKLQVTSVFPDRGCWVELRPASLPGVHGVSNVH